jgi:hypothetical protein
MVRGKVKGKTQNAFLACAWGSARVPHSGFFFFFFWADLSPKSDTIFFRQ